MNGHQLDNFVVAYTELAFAKLIYSLPIQKFDCNQVRPDSHICFALEVEAVLRLLVGMVCVEAFQFVSLRNGAL